MLVVGFLASNSATLWAMAQRPADPNAPPPPAWVSWMPIVFMVGIFYFLLIRPQTKQRSEQKKMIDSLKKGDKIVTQGGFIATIVNINPSNFEIKLNDETKVKILRSAVTDLYVESNPSSESDKVMTVS